MRLSHFFARWRVTCGLMCCAVSCQAALEWKNPRVEKSAVAGDAPVVANFDFVNTGSSAVTITTVVSDCGCTTAALDRRIYAPGEGGTVRATFDIGGRVGQQEKIVTVTTDDAAAEPVRLALAVNIAELVRAVPRLAIWRIGDASDEKVIEILAGASPAIARLEVTPDAGAEARLEAVEGGRKYRLHVRPKSTATMTTMPVRCTAQFEGRAPATFSVFVLVK